MKKPNCPIIAIEEHYWDSELAKTFAGAEARLPDRTKTLISDVGDVRLKEMDEAGIDIQVLSHGAPSTQQLPADTAVKLAAGANDRALAQRKPRSENGDEIRLERARGQGRRRALWARGRCR